MDPVHGWTDEEIGRLERRMVREYGAAAREMRAKLDRFLKRYAADLEAREKALDDTPEARKALEAWKRDRAADRSWMQGMISSLSRDLEHARERATALLGDRLPRIYAENANYGAFEVDRAARVDTAFTLMDEDTARQLMGEGQLLFEPPRPDAAKVRAWTDRKLASAMTQGILQGESIPHIADRLRTVAGMSASASVRTARTACTGAENAGRVSSYRRAERLGIGLRQEWLATLDARTRDSHRVLDGERAEVGEKFSNGLRFPGDPQGPAAEVYNCRCTLVAAVDGIDQSDAARFDRLPDGMSYEEWKQQARDRMAGQQVGEPDQFDFDAYVPGDAIASKRDILDSLPQEMHDSEVYDYDLGTMSEAEYAVRTMARYTTDDWKRYRYDGYLEKAIQESSKQYEGPMFRGVRMPASRLEELDVGAVIEPQGVQSWSRNHGTALDYCDMRRGGRPTVLVDVTEGKHTALSIEAVSQYSGEAEVLSSGRIQYEVVRKYDREFEHFSLRRDEPTINTTVIEVRELRG